MHLEVEQAYQRSFLHDTLLLQAPTERSGIATAYHNLDNQSSNKHVLFQVAGRCIHAIGYLKKRQSLHIVGITCVETSGDNMNHPLISHQGAKHKWWTVSNLTLGTVKDIMTSKVTKWRSRGKRKKA